MAVIVADTVNCAPCEFCPRERCVVTERTGRSGVRVTVIKGCAECDGSTLVLPG